MNEKLQNATFSSMSVLQNHQYDLIIIMEENTKMQYNI